MTTPSSRGDLGDEIRRRRKAAKMTQADLAKLAAVATTNVGKLERGARVSSTTLRAVARALELPPEMVNPHLDEPRDSNEPRPGDFPDKLEYLEAVYWYLRKSMSHEAVLRGFEMAAAEYQQRRTNSDRSTPPGDTLGRSS